MPDPPPAENGRHDGTLNSDHQPARSRSASPVREEEGEDAGLVGDVSSKAKSMLASVKRTAAFDEAAREFEQGEEEENAEVFAGFLILHPYSTPRLGWDVWVVFLLLYTVIQVPYQLSFDQTGCGVDEEFLTTFLGWFVDVCFWTDMLLNFRTAFPDPHSDGHAGMVLITSPKLIARNYLRGWFWLDLAGSFPLQSIVTAMDDPGCDVAALKTLKLNRIFRMVRLVKLLRLVRLARWNKLITKARDTLSIHPGHLRLAQSLGTVFLLAHLIACLLYYIVSWEEYMPSNWAVEATLSVGELGTVRIKCPEQIFDEVTGELTADNPTIWYMEEVHGKLKPRGFQCLDDSGEYMREASPFVKYAVSLYITFTTLTTVGYGDITQKTTPELILSIIMMALGASTFAVIVGNMAALIGKLDIRAADFKEQMDDLDDFMHQEHLPLDLRMRTRSFFDYRFNNARDIPSSILELSTSLRTEVALHLYADLITSVPFFKHCGSQFLTALILKLQTQTLSPGDLLYEAGEFGDSMFFLIKGSVEVVVDEEHGIYAEMKQGSYFGENCVLGLSDTRAVTVRATTWCNLLYVSSEGLEDAIAAHPESHENFQGFAEGKSAVERTVSDALATMESMHGDLSGLDREPCAFGESSGASEVRRLLIGGEDQQDKPPSFRETPEATHVHAPVVMRALARSRRNFEHSERHRTQEDADEHARIGGGGGSRGGVGSRGGGGGVQSPLRGGLQSPLPRKRSSPLPKRGDVPSSESGRHLSLKEVPARPADRSLRKDLLAHVTLSKERAQQEALETREAFSRTLH